MSHKCTCDWCPAYREDLDAQTKGYDRALAQLAEARAENERLRAALARLGVHRHDSMCSPTGFNVYECDCGADAHNAEVDAALARPTGRIP